jgi:transcriptional regulator with XRE-family HTH domain
MKTSARRAEQQRHMNVLQRRLDDERRAHGLTYAELGRLAGMSTGAAHYLLNGPMKRMPKRMHEHLVGMSKALPGVTLAELMRLAGKVFGISVYSRRGERFEIQVASTRPLSDDELAAVEAHVDALQALLDVDRDQAAAAAG